MIVVGLKNCVGSASSYMKIQQAADYLYVAVGYIFYKSITNCENVLKLF